MALETPPPSEADTPARFFVFMGVCGVGKTTIAKATAGRLDATFIDADSLHPPENVAIMSAGRGLTDAERWPWIEAVCAAALEIGGDDGMVLVACSALKRRYRDRFRTRLPRPVFIHLTGAEEVIRERLNNRKDHFMAPGMLDGQLTDLESPEDEADCVTLDIDRSRDDLANCAVSICRQRSTAAGPGSPGSRQ